MLKKVISGGQTGADIAGVETAKKFGYETGGNMPFGYKTLNGCRPEYKDLYGMKVHYSSSYVPRTKLNVLESDGTIRLAFNFESPGEICTKKAIDSYKKPHIDVNLNDPIPISCVTEWLSSHTIAVLNVAGNAEEHNPGTHDAAVAYLEQLFEALATE